MESAVELIRDLLIFIVAMIALLIAFIVIVAKMPDNNAFKRILSALCYRVGATVVAGVLALPIEPIPGVDVIYDLGAILALVWYWFTFFRDTCKPAFHSTRSLPSRPPPPPDLFVVKKSQNPDP
jgi:hypothetical protein